MIDVEEEKVRGNVIAPQLNEPLTTSSDAAYAEGAAPVQVEKTHKDEMHDEKHENSKDEAVEEKNNENKNGKKKRKQAR